MGYVVLNVVLHVVLQGGGGAGALLTSSKSSPRYDLRMRIHWYKNSNTREGFTCERVTATRYNLLWRQYKNDAPSTILTGGWDPVSFEAMTFMLKESAVALETSSLRKNMGDQCVRGCGQTRRVERKSGGEACEFSTEGGVGTGAGVW